MKKSIKFRLLSMVLMVAMLCSMLPTTALAASTPSGQGKSSYTINGNTVTYNKLTLKYTQGKGYYGEQDCFYYAKDIYEQIWGTVSNFSGNPNTSNNMLRYLSDSNLTLTAKHLQEYVTAAAVGSVLRVCAAEELNTSSDGKGHSVIIVAKCSEGFTVFEGGSSSNTNHCRVKYYTWQQFVTTHTTTNDYRNWTNDYIKYIKWPSASYYLNDISCKLTNSTSGVAISWSVVSGASKYYVYRKTSSGSWEKIKETTSTSYTDSTASSGTTYSYYVCGVSSYGTLSGYSTKSIKYLEAGKVTSVSNAASSITVKWNKVSGASGYYIYRKDGSSSYSLVATITSGSTTSWSDSDARKKPNGQLHTYYVIPYSGSYTGDHKNTQTIAGLNAISSVSLSNSSSKKMTVQWGSTTGVTGYQIWYSTDSSFSNKKSVTVSGYKSYLTTISGLTKNKTYYVKIRAYKTYNGTTYYSAWSSVKKIKITK